MIVPRKCTQFIQIVFLILPLDHDQTIVKRSIDVNNDYFVNTIIPFHWHRTWYSFSIKKKPSVVAMATVRLRLHGVNFLRSSSKSSSELFGRNYYFTSFQFVAYDVSYLNAEVPNLQMVYLSLLINLFIAPTNLLSFLKSTYLFIMQA